MSKHNNPNQISFFNPTSLEILPFPSHRSDLKYSAGKVRQADTEERLHCSIDIVAWGKGENYDTARQSYKDYKRTIEADSTGGIFTPVEIKARADDGKMRKTDFLNDEQMLRLLIETPGKLTGVAKDWLSKVGAERIEETENPELGIQRANERADHIYKIRGRDDTWIGFRLNGIDFRKLFTLALSVHVRGADFPAATNAVYIAILTFTASELRKVLGLRERDNIRDALSWQALWFLALAEATIAHNINDRESLSWPEACEIIRKVCALVGKQAREYEDQQQVNLLTGQALISA